MPKSLWLKYTLALVVAGVGVGLTLRAVMPRRHMHGGTPPPEHRDWHSGPNAADADARARADMTASNQDDDVFVIGGRAVAASAFVKPTPETLDRVVEEAVRSAGKALSQMTSDVALDQEKTNDLLAFLRERLRLWLDMDSEKYLESLTKRGFGAAQSAEKHHAQDLIRFHATGRRYRFTPVAVSDVGIRARYRAGTLVPREDPPPLVTWSWSGAFDIPDDPRSGKLDVYEVQVPVYAPTDRIDPVSRLTVGEGPPSPAMLGLEVAWSEQQQQWIPYRIHIYGQGKSNAFFYPPPYP